MRHRVSLCADPRGGLDGYYGGHDEPSLEFKSSVRGSGNDMTYVVTLPKDPTVEPNATGVGGTTWGFEQYCVAVQPKPSNACSNYVLWEPEPVNCVHRDQP